MLSLQNLLRPIQPEHWFQCTSKISIKCWCCFQMSTGQRWLMILLFLVSKFHILVKYPCNIRFCCAIVLTEQIITYQLGFHAILEYQKDKMSLWSYHRLLCFGYSRYLLASDLSLAIQFQKLYETFPTNIGWYHISSPASACAWVPVPSKDYYLPDYVWTTKDYFGSFIPFLPKRLHNHWLLISAKLSLISELSPISHPAVHFGLGKFSWIPK